MSRHVAPHRWADAFAGRLPEAERAQLDAHAARCPACARARDRVTRASDSFAAIKQQPPPELPWDSVRVRVHWAVSSAHRERLARKPRRSRLAWAGGLGLAAALTGGVLFAVTRVTSGGAAPVVEPLAESVIAPIAGHVSAPGRAAAPAPAPLAGLVNRTTGELMIDGLLPDDVFAQRLVAGTVLATGDGRVDVQFADASAFALGPRSMLELRRFDGDAIELVVEGTIDIEVAPRAAHQRFVVHAGSRTIEVRGTQFRVVHDATTTTVACRHGLVAVRDASGQVEVGAARRVELSVDQAVTLERVRPLSIDQVDELARAAPMTIPLWNIEALVQGSAPLEVATVGRREIRVDGVELGAAPLRVRVLPGRHTVEAADAAGRFRRAGWVDVATAGAGAKAARIEVPAEPPRTRGIGERRRQLQAGIARPRLAQCMRSIAKAGLTGTYVQIEIAVDAQGAVGFLNVIDTDLPSSTASCVRGVLADVRFGAGAPATWRERIDL